MATQDLYIVATITSRTGAEEQLRKLLTKAVDAFRQEDGCLAYSLLEDKKRAGRFVTYERWRDEAALAAHMHSPTMEAAAPQLKTLLEGEMTQDFLGLLVAV